MARTACVSSTYRAKTGLTRSLPACGFSTWTGGPRVVLGVGPAGQPFSVFAEQERLETGQRHDIADIPEQAGRE